MSDNQITQLVNANPWRNVYWFSRMLINSDKYGSVGKDNKLMATLGAKLRVVLQDKSQGDDAKLLVCKKMIRELIDERFSNASSKLQRIKLFLADLDELVLSVEDIAVLVLTMESVMIPINTALNSIPSNDREFTEATARTYLDELKEVGLASVINIWDDLGVHGCLTAERVAVVREFARLRYDLKDLPEYEANLILTAFVQEFERRLGQKRKGRAGGSLEDVTSFILSYFKITVMDAPEHFQSDIEVDKWLKCKDRWLIGISCKRTLRERWKQVSSADRGVLSKFKIKELWHLITYDEDLSDDKLTLLGNQGHIFYLRDDSRRLEHARGHIGMQGYVRPMSDFIKDLRIEIG